MSTDAEKQLHRLLEYLEGRIDLDHVARARERRRAALDFEPLDAPPLVCCLPYEGRDFAPYTYREAFDDPAKMMVNELLVGFTSVCHAADFRDDAPYCLRPNFGTGVTASMFGAEIRLVADDAMPWVAPVGAEGVRDILAAAVPDVAAGLGRKVIEQYAFYDAVLEAFPACREAFDITLPDLQGPFDTAELLWGSEIFVALGIEPETVTALLDRITDQMIRAWQTLAPLTRDRQGEGMIHQHAVGVKGNLLIRNDSAILMSPAMYAEAVAPFDARLGEALGGVAIHFCGNGEAHVPAMLDTGVRCLDFGQSHMMDVDAIYAQCAPRRVPIVRLQLPDEEMTAAEVQRRFPTGVILVFQAGGGPYASRGLAAARDVLERCSASRRE